MLKFEAKKGDFAKIWQKLGGYSPPSPPGSAAHGTRGMRFSKVFIRGLGQRGSYKLMWN